jgi:hypothetical protein
LKGKKIPRDSSGTYTLPGGNPVVSGTIISSTWANNTNSDIAQALTDSLDRQGRGAMSAALLVYDGTQAAPGLGFGSEPGSGLRRIGTQQLALDVGGADVLRFNGAGAPTLPGQINALGRVNFPTGLTITAAPTTDLGTLNAQTVQINATAAPVTISSFGSSAPAGAWYLVVFDLAAGGTITLQQSPNLGLPGNVNISVQPNDWMLALCDSAGQWLIIFYQHRARAPQGYYGGYVAADIVGNVLPVGWSATHPGLGQYTVNISPPLSGNYAVSVEFITATGFHRISTTAPASFDVLTFNTASTAADMAFMFTLCQSG